MWFDWLAGSYPPNSGQLAFNWRANMSDADSTKESDGAKEKAGRLDLNVPQHLLDYLKLLVERRTAMGRDASAVAVFLLTREVERLMEAQHHQKDWR